jgi:hypothetical protein
MPVVAADTRYSGRAALGKGNEATVVPRLAEGTAPSVKALAEAALASCDGSVIPRASTREEPEMSKYASGNYWAKRRDMMYYRYIDRLVRTAGADANSLIDVGSGNCPYLEWFYWIERRVSVDIDAPYASETVEGIRGDIHELTFPGRFDLCTCFQVLEHIPDATSFARRLLELSDRVIVSVPYKWPTQPKTPDHVHDPVTHEKLSAWMGREPNWQMVVSEPVKSPRARRLIAIYDADPSWRLAMARSRRVPHSEWILSQTITAKGAGA